MAGAIARAMPTTVAATPLNNTRREKRHQFVLLLYYNSQPDPIIRRVHKILLGPQIPFGRLYRSMSQ